MWEFIQWISSYKSVRLQVAVTAKSTTSPPLCTYAPAFEKSQSFISTRAYSQSICVSSVHVFIKCKAGTEDAFKEASLKNARCSANEKGVARFDVMQDKEDSTQFVLVEVYKDADTAPAAHKETAHYAEWRDTVANMMAEPRTARKFDNLFPGTAVGWEYRDTSKLE